MIMPIPIHTNSCPCAEPMPDWVGVVLLIFFVSAFIIMIPIWADVIGGIIKIWSEFIDDIKWNIKHRGDK